MSGQKDAESVGVDTDPLIDKIVGERYRLVERIGSGGMGTVYKAQHTLMGKQLAVKILHPELAILPEVMGRFEREAVALAKIAHPNVVNASDFGQLESGAYFLVLEYIDGTSLGRVIAGNPLPPERVARIAIQIARALSAAHKQNLVHRDLKPENLMLIDDAEQGELVKVLDFGMAKLRSIETNEDASITRPGAVFGTPHYMSPEQITGQAVDGRADLYSLGLICYEMLTGRRPFKADNVRSLLAMQVNNTAEPLPKDIPRALRTLVDQLMAKDAAERPASADEVIERLEEYLNNPTASAQSTGSSDRQRSRWLSVALTVTVVAVVAIAGIAYRGQRQRSNPLPPPVANSTVAIDPAILSAAEFGDQEALEKILNTLPNQRELAAWLALGNGLMKQQKTLQALDAYAEAVTFYPELAEETQLIRHVSLATTDKRSAEKALQLAADSLGSAGVDILFSVWSSTSKRTKVTALAAHYLQSEQVRERGSPAVQVALDLREDHDCETMTNLVQRAKKVADIRSLRPLLRLEQMTGCGPDETHDCYPCLRNSSTLTDTIQAVRERPAPEH